MNGNCIFCQIVAGQERAQAIASWPDAIAFFPLNPATPGHTLLIPKAHYADILEVDQDTFAHLSRYSLTLARAIRDGLSPDGLNLLSSAGPAASQTIFHLHIHLVPRWDKDRMGDIWPPDKAWDQKTLDNAASSIKNSMTA
ncbi:HIT domain-containing protein [Saccharomonospora azurea]|uniref:HIT family protein n=1 Tax=Saccharomonospora azurea TaxID=40988 RepID=UPI00331B538C